MFITAAGSLNYADLGQFFPDAERVLRDGGALIQLDLHVIDPAVDRGAGIHDQE